MDRVLFTCAHNSARSQIAEAYLGKYGGDGFFVESAGLEPGELNPFVVRALLEDGLDISRKKTQSVFDLFRAGKQYHYVVAVCSRETEEKCPVFPGMVERLHWPFPDPAQFRGSDEEIMARVRDLRDSIKSRVLQFVEVTRSTG